VARPLVARFWQPVRADDLVDAWKGNLASTDAFRSCIGELRRHVAPLGLTIVAVRSHLYVLDACP
jgi:hypothetical protein